MRRFRINGVEQRAPFPIVKITLLDEPAFDRKKIAPLVATVKKQMSRLITLSPDIPDAAAGVLDSIDDPGFLADLIASNLSIALDEKQKLLETTSQKGRVENIMEFVSGRIHELEMTKGRDLAGWNPEIKILH